MRFGQSFKPMLLTEIANPFDDPKYLYELKFDGFRSIIHVSPNKFYIFSRNGYNITFLYPELKSIQKLVKNEMIFDGEIVTFVDNVPNFSKLQARSHLKDLKKIEQASIQDPVCFIAFDCLYNSSDITEEKILNRKKILNQIPDSNYFIKTQYILNDGIKLFEKVKRLNLEGIVAKNIESTYEIDTRSAKWIKIKNVKDEVFYVGGYEEKVGKAISVLYLGEYQEDKFCYVGKVLIGKKNPFYQKLLKEKIIKKSPFSNFSGENINFLKPKLSCEITYLEKTKSNHLRHPVFKREKN